MVELGIICILSLGGTVGKTLIASQLLMRYLIGARFFAVEVANEAAAAYGEEVEQMGGGKFQKLFRELMILMQAVVDVGGSCAKDFIDGLMRYANAQQEFAFFLIPCTNGPKEQREAIALVEILKGLGIGANRIKIICNRVQDDVMEEFSAVFDFAQLTGSCEISADWAIWEWELIPMLQKHRMSLADILADTQDHREIARRLGPNGDQKELEMHRDLHVMQGLAVNVRDNFDQAFRALFPGWVGA
jgi:hypothetical protein